MSVFIASRARLSTAAEEMGGGGGGHPGAGGFGGNYSNPEDLFRDIFGQVIFF